MPLGLISSETLDDYWSQNTRRRIFYAYPNGAAPLTGLLSLMENKDTPQPEFGWNEERWAAIKTQTATGPTANVAFYTAGTTTGLTSPYTIVQFTAIRVYVADASNFQVDDTVVLFSLDLTSGTADLNGRVTLVNSTGSPFYIEIEPINVPASTLLTAATNNLAKYVYLTGSAYAEAARSRTGRQRFPSEIKNFTQIQKTAFELTRTALKEPLKYDKGGAYKDVAKSNGIDHLSQIELTAFFGRRAKTTAVDPDTGMTVRRGYTGGLRWYLDQWELGSVAAGGAFDYGQPNVSALTDFTANTTKRVIKLGGTTITRTQFNTLMGNLFARTNSSDWSKLALCGPGYLGKVADMFERQIQWTSLRDEGFEGFNFKLSWHRSNAGDVYYKTHPLFNDPIMNNSCFYVDLGYMGYRPLTDSDTDIQPMIQLPDADKRKDQWLTEYGFEVPFPEAFMYVENLGGITLT
jgi:hypothetical protein